MTHWFLLECVFLRLELKPRFPRKLWRPQKRNCATFVPFVTSAESFEEQTSSSLSTSRSCRTWYRQFIVFANTSSIHRIGSKGKQQFLLHSLQFFLWCFLFCFGLSLCFHSHWTDLRRWGCEYVLIQFNLYWPLSIIIIIMLSPSPLHFLTSVF